MDKEKEIEGMMKLILEAEMYHRRTLCLNKVGKSRVECVCENLYNAGYGNVAQAVKEFAEKLKDRIKNLMDIPFDGKTKRQFYKREGMEDGLKMSMDFISSILKEWLEE